MPGLKEVKKNGGGKIEGSLIFSLHTFINAAASSSAVPPISPMRMIPDMQRTPFLVSPHYFPHQWAKDIHQSQVTATILFS